MPTSYQEWMWGREAHINWSMVTSQYLCLYFESVWYYRSIRKVATDFWVITGGAGRGRCSFRVDKWQLILGSKHVYTGCCCFSHPAHWLPTRKKLKKTLYTVANPARGLLNRKKKKKKVWQRLPPPKRAARSDLKKKKNHATYRVVIVIRLLLHHRVKVN